MAENDKQYDAGTLVAAAVIFIGFGLVLFFLPNIMMSIGARSPVLAGAIVAGVLVLPFLGLWLRGRARKRK